jgi:drug/metabolite transporter (DMT)-like permease
VPGVSVLEYTGYTAALALPSLFAIAIVATLLGWACPPTYDDVAAVLPAFAYITAVGTVLAALAFNFGVRTLGATNGIVFINLVPVSALFIGWWDGQAPNGAEWLGTGLVTAALLLLAKHSGAPAAAANAVPATPAATRRVLASGGVK